MSDTDIEPDVLLDMMISDASGDTRKALVLLRSETAERKFWSKQAYDMARAVGEAVPLLSDDHPAKPGLTEALRRARDSAFTKLSPVE